jgi:ssDNA-binding Zn-finger/Zn-ribbon topoisomerase 1
MGFFGFMSGAFFMNGTGVFGPFGSPKLCKTCGSEMTVSSNRYGRIIECSNPKCDIRENSWGIQSDSETRELRIEAHEQFDILWKTGIMDRDEAYGWLTSKFKSNYYGAHFANMNKEQLFDALSFIEDKLEEEAEKCLEYLENIIDSDFNEDIFEKAANCVTVIMEAGMRIPGDTLDFIVTLRMTDNDAERRQTFRMALGDMEGRF